MGESATTGQPADGTGKIEMETIGEGSNDMEDSPEEIESYSQPMNNALAYFQDTFASSFARNDTSAKKQQWRHRTVVRVFSVAGTFAVVFSILHLTRLIPLRDQPQLAKFLPLALFFGEAIAVLIALLAVAVGLVLAFQSNWLVQRHKAELFRLLKFGSIIDPAMLAGNEEDFKRWKERLLTKAHEIKGLNRNSVDEWVEEARIPDLPPPPLQREIQDTRLQDLINYYQKKRLDPQSKYFYDQAHHNLMWDWSTRLVPPFLFFGSVFFALLHLVNEILELRHGTADYFAKWSHEVDTVSVSFIILAAILPVFGAGLRGLRSAYEFGRNTLRFSSMHFALELLRERIQKESKPESVLRDLWWCEWMLESEHREWLRLMIEAEWIG